VNRCMFDLFTLVSVSLRHTKNESPIRSCVETFVWRKDTFRLWKMSNMQRFTPGFQPSSLCCYVVISWFLNDSKCAFRTQLVAATAWSARGKKLRAMYRSRLKLEPDRFRILPLEMLNTLRGEYGFHSMWPSTVGGGGVQAESSYRPVA
jgi:hypothetical protein